MSCPNVPIGRFYNVNKSCQVIVGNPPIVQGLSPRSCKALGLLDSPREARPSESFSSKELVKIESEALYLSQTRSHSVVVHRFGRRSFWG